jgi:PAS domain S-box-containing protein
MYPASLHEKEERLRMVADAAELGYCDWNLLSNNKPAASARFKTLFGFSPETAIDHAAILGAIHPEDREHTAATARDALQQKQQFRLEFRIIRPEGSTHWLTAAGWGFYDETGQATRVFAVVRDISLRKQLEARLRSERDLVETFLEHVPVGFVGLDRNLRHVKVSQRFCQDFALQKNLILGNCHYDAVPDLPEQIKEAHRRGLAGESVTSETEVCFEPAEGQKAWSRWKVLPWGDSGTESGGIIVVSEDITERKRAELAQQESERQYRDLFENSPIGVYRTTPDGRVLMANPALIAMLEYSSFEELSSHNLENEDYDRKLFKTLIERHGSVRGLEYLLTTRNGSRIHIREHARAVRGLDGATLFYEGTIEDITEHKKAAEEVGKLLAIVEQLPDFVGVANLDGSIAYINPGGCKLCGFASVEEARGKRVADIEWPPGSFQTILATITSGQKFTGEYSFRHVKTGETVPVEMMAFLMRDQYGVPAGVAGIARDLRERQRAEREMRALEEQFRHAQKMEAIGRLAGGVAHDFNNLLQIINNYSNLIVENAGADTTLGRRAEAILQAGERAAQLTGQLLAFSRKQVIEPKVFELDSAVSDFEDILRRLIPESIEVKTNLRSGGGCVRIAPSQLEQVIMNLVVNARDAMPAGGQLTIETLQADFRVPPVQPAGDLAPGVYLKLAVSDTGHGMDEATRMRIFEPFFTTKPPGEGTGLGLSTVYGIVRQNGGGVHVYSEPGIGSTFNIYLPMFSEKAPPTNAVPLGPMPSGTETILVAEDEEAVRKLIRDLLEGLGYRVFDAADGDQALEIFRQQMDQIDFVITDTIMPKMGGWELCGHLRNLQPELKILLISGYSDGVLNKEEEIRAAGLRLLSKPFAFHTLAHRLREMLDV